MNQHPEAFFGLLLAFFWHLKRHKLNFSKKSNKLFLLQTISSTYKKKKTLKISQVHWAAAA